MMRSKLFVPALRVDLYEKALQADADAVCFDLEDAVLPGRRPEARGHLEAFLKSRRPVPRPLLLVRVNPVESEDFLRDLAAGVWSSVHGLCLPKVGSKEQVVQAADALANLETIRGLTTPIALLPTIESARGLRLAHAIATGAPRVTGLQLGFADLLGALGIAQDHTFSRNQTRWSLRLAAAEAGIPCYDSAYANYNDALRFEQEVQSARSLGFAGASCIHPSQVAAANRVFSPTAEEIANARRVIEAAEVGEKEGRGATSLNGVMIDRPFLLRAREILRQVAQRDC